MYPGEHDPIGVPLIKAADLSGNYINQWPQTRITAAKHQEYRRTALSGGELLISLVGEVGRCAIVPREMSGWNAARAVAVLRFREPSDAEFARSLLMSGPLQHLMHAWSTTTVQATLNLKEIRQIPLPWPGERQRHSISHILGALDDKIELNRRSNETLEAMARALFKEWCCNHPTGFPRETIAQLTRNGILTIGDGYRAKNDELGGVGLPFIRAGELKNGFDTDGADVLNENSVRLAGDKVSRVGDVAFTSKGTIGRFARVTDQTPAFVYSPQVCFWRATNVARLRPEILYAWMVSDDCRAQIDAVAGQTDMALYVSLRDQRAMTMPIFGPDQHVVADLIKPLLARQATNSAETRTLATLRDTLLPKLLSGELRVRDADSIVSKTV